MSEGVGIFGEKHGVIIDINLEWAAMEQESGGEEIEVGEEKFPGIELGANEQTAAIVEHVEHGKVQRRWGKPTMRGSIQLPQFADLGALPAAHGSKRAFGWSGMGEAIFKRPVADLGAIQLEGLQAQGFGSNEAVRARRGASQPFFEEVNDRFRPGDGMVAAGGSRDPQTFFLSRAGGEVTRGERIKAAAR